MCVPTGLRLVFAGSFLAQPQSIFLVICLEAMISVDPRQTNPLACELQSCTPQVLPGPTLTPAPALAAAHSSALPAQLPSGPCASRMCPPGSARSAQMGRGRHSTVVWVIVGEGISLSQVMHGCVHPPAPSSIPTRTTRSRRDATSSACSSVRWRHGLLGDACFGNWREFGPPALRLGQYAPLTPMPRPAILGPNELPGTRRAYANPKGGVYSATNAKRGF